MSSLLKKMRELAFRKPLASWMYEEDAATNGPRPDFETALASFVRAIQEKLNKYYAKRFPSQSAPTISVDPKGVKYVRIVSNKSSVYCFIDKATGDILKAAGWKAPAKGARGNIYAADPTKGTGPYGAEYKTGGSYPWQESVDHVVQMVLEGPKNPTIRDYLTVLVSNLTQYDKATGAREAKKGRTNIYRLGHLLKAAHEVEAKVQDILDDTSPEARKKLEKVLAQHFILTSEGEFDLPPLRNLVKQLHAGTANIKVSKSAKAATEATDGVGGKIDAKKAVRNFLGRMTPGEEVTVDAIIQGLMNQPEIKLTPAEAKAALDAAVASGHAERDGEWYAPTFKNESVESSGDLLSEMRALLGEAKKYIVYVDGEEQETITAGSHNAAEKNSGKQVQVSCTEEGVEAPADGLIAEMRALLGEGTDPTPGFSDRDAHAAKQTDITNTIASQMGGIGRIRMMLGGKLSVIPNGLSIQWPNKERARGNYLEVTLRPDDTYDMTFFNVAGGKKKEVKKYEMIYADQLTDIFRKQTGRALKL